MDGQQKDVSIACNPISVAALISTVILGLAFFAQQFPAPTSPATVLEGDAAVRPPIVDPIYQPASLPADAKMKVQKFSFIDKKIRALNPRTNSTNIARVIVSESYKMGYNPLIVASLIKSESAFNKSARSNKGAIGLMQLLPSTAKYISRKVGMKWYGARALKDPKYNIKLGIAYFKYLEEMFNGDQELALMAYNWGPGNLRRALRKRRQIFRSVSRYAQKVISTSEKWQIEFHNHLQTIRPVVSSA